jgi:hypothetical protein
MSCVFLICIYPVLSVFFVQMHMWPIVGDMLTNQICHLGHSFVVLVAGEVQERKKQKLWVIMEGVNSCMNMMLYLKTFVVSCSCLRTYQKLLYWVDNEVYVYVCYWLFSLSGSPEFMRRVQHSATAGSDILESHVGWSAIVWISETPS